MKGILEIRDPIYGPISVLPDEMAVVDSPYFQRLRGIKQLGFADLTFPGATHNRYSHSLGAFHLAGRAFDRIFQDFPFKDAGERQYFRYLLRLAALLHDSGHGPLSHAIEQAMPLKKDVLGDSKSTRASKNEQASHEDYTEAIILKSSLSQILKSVFGKDTPLALVSLIRNENRKPELFLAGKKKLNLFPLLSSLISGELDVDRMDYMARDSLYCGIPYGHFDRDWIFSNLSYVDLKGNCHLALDSRALYAFEDFLLSRYHLYLMVYLHHKSVIYDEMLYQFLLSKDSKTKVPSSVDEYLKVDDYWLRSRLLDSKNHWARRIIEHKPYKMLLEVHSDSGDDAREYADKLEGQLIHARINYFRSSSSGLLSKYQQTRAEKVNEIYVIYRDPRFVSASHPGISSQPLSEATDLFDRYKNKRIIDRLYAETELK